MRFAYRSTSYFTTHTQARGSGEVCVRRYIRYYDLRRSSDGTRRRDTEYPVPRSLETRTILRQFQKRVRGL